jgi:hypothetical protein
MVHRRFALTEMSCAPSDNVFHYIIMFRGIQYKSSRYPLMVPLQGQCCHVTSPTVPSYTDIDMQ